MDFISFKLRNGMLPDYLSVNVRSVADSQSYNLRNSDHLRLLSTVNNSEQNSMLYKGIRIFNDLSI